MARAFHAIAETIRQIRDGEYMQALPGADGTSGSLPADTQHPDGP